MEDGIERSMSFLITDLEKKQRITAPKYEEQVHPIGLSLISRETTPISVIDTTQDITPISRDNTPIGRDNTPIGRDNTPIVREEACPNTGPKTGQETLGSSSPLANTTPNLPSTNTGSDS
jgi:hypothetical protein